MLKKLDELVGIYYKDNVHKLKNEKYIRIIEITDAYIVIDYKDIYIQFYIDKAEYKKFIIDYYTKELLPIETEIVTFLDSNELSYLLEV